MNRFVTWLAAAAFAVAGLMGGGAANAAWLGLDEGTYGVLLDGCASQPFCTSNTGTITVAGSGLSFMSFTLDGILFEGDPNDYVQDGTAERSDITYFSPFTFFSLVKGIGEGTPNFWFYCKNVQPNACRPEAGFWTATKVPEPGTLALFASALAFLGVGRTLRRRGTSALA